MKKGGRSVALSLQAALGHHAHRTQGDGRRLVRRSRRLDDSTAFTTAPVPFLKSFIDANPIGADYDKVWDRSLPLSSYQGQDDGKGEGKVVGLDQHVSASARRARRQARCGLLRALAALALRRRISRPHGSGSHRRARSSARARRPTSSASASRPPTPSGTSTDRAATRSRISSSGSIARSAKLLDHLDAKVGKGNYVLGLSADHGVSEIPEQIGGGRVSSKAVGTRTQKVLDARARAGHARAVVGLHEHLPG